MLKGKKNIDEQIKTLEELEKKILYYKLKRWEKKLLKYLKKLLFLDLKKKEHINIMENKKIKYEEKIKYKNKKYEKLNNKIMEEKNKAIKSKEEDKIQKIEKNKEKYDNLIEYLESIKNDKEKLMAYFSEANLIIITRTNIIYSFFYNINNS